MTLPLPGILRWRALLLFATILSAAWLSIACDHRDDFAPSGIKALPTTQMQVGDQTFTFEIANTDSTRMRGLMKRDSMPADHGMIFVFPDEAERSFWMRDTRFPLDILFVDASGKVVSVRAMKPYDLSSTPSDGPAKYAIELNAGAAERAGVKAGDVLGIPAEAREPAEE